MGNARTLTRDFRRLLRRATRPSMRMIAKEMHVSEAIVELHANRAKVSPRMAVKLRRWAEGYAAQLLKLAARLPPEEER